MDSSFSTSPEWTLGYTPVQSDFAPTGLFAPFPTGNGGKEDLMNDSVYGLFDEGRDSSAYLHATPPCATPLRRARSSSAILTPIITSSTWSFQGPPSPSSPLSETIPTPRDGQQMNGGSWFAAEQSAFLNSIPAGQQQQQQRGIPSPPQFTNQLATPQSEGTLRQRRRYPSAQPALPSQGAPEMASRSHSYQSARGDLSLSVPMVQQPSVEDVNQFFSEMQEILGPEAMAAISPPANYGDSVTSPSYSRPSPSNGPPTYQVNGVILDAEDYALYSQSPSINFRGQQWPQSAPPTQTSFSHYDTRPIHPRANQRGSPSPHPQQQRPQQSQFGYSADYPATAAFTQGFVPPPRPRSAPASPELGSGAFAPFSHEGSFQPQQQEHGAAPYLRRGSSADAMPRSFPQAPMEQQHQQYPHPHPPPPHHFQQRTPPRYHQQQAPYYPHPEAMYGSGNRFPPSPHYAHHGGPPASPSPIGSLPPTLRRMSSTPVGLNSINPRPVAPLKKPGGKGKRGKAEGGFSFINFTASDAPKLLGGVAPSGSSKRKREEEQAAEERRAAKKKATAV